jgi:hypothetical protein
MNLSPKPKPNLSLNMEFWWLRRKAEALFMGSTVNPNNNLVTFLLGKQRFLTV